MIPDPVVLSPAQQQRVRSELRSILNFYKWDETYQAEVERVVSGLMGMIVARERALDEMKTAVTAYRCAWDTLERLSSGINNLGTPSSVDAWSRVVPNGGDSGCFADPSSTEGLDL